MASPLNTMNLFMIAIVIAAGLSVMAKTDPGSAPTAPSLQTAIWP